MLYSNLPVPPHKYIVNALDKWDKKQVHYDFSLVAILQNTFSIPAIFILDVVIAASFPPLELPWSVAYQVWQQHLLQLDALVELR